MIVCPAKRKRASSQALSQAPTVPPLPVTGPDSLSGPNRSAITATQGSSSSQPKSRSNQVSQLFRKNRRMTRMNQLASKT